MPIYSLSYDDFLALCEGSWASIDHAPTRPPRRFGPHRLDDRFRGRWFHAADGLLMATRPGIRRKGFPRSGQSESTADRAGRIKPSAA